VARTRRYSIEIKDANGKSVLFTTADWDEEDRRAAVRAENLNPNVVMMKSAKHWACANRSNELDRARLWRGLVQRPVSSNLVVVAGIRLEGSAQVRFTHDHNMVEALPPDRSDKPFDMAILPRRAGCGRMVTDPHS
jgi:hypothetical protein